MTSRMATATDIARYPVHGLALVPIPRGRKGPVNAGWNERASAILDPDRASRIVGNVGLAHAWSTPSPTCALDIDAYADAEAWLAAEGIDLQALLAADDAVQIRSGREGRAKLLYRLPHIMATRRISRDGVTLFELRCADAAGLSVQDVLPPSIHPDTGQPYQWAGAGDWRHIPDIPPALFALWKRIHTVTASPSGQVMPSGRAQVDMPPDGIADLRSALLQIDADDRDTWIRIGHALATIKDEAAAFEAWIRWSSTSDKFDYHDATRVWLSFQPHNTGPAAVFAEAQRRGWSNPRAYVEPPLPEPPAWMSDTFPEPQAFAPHQMPAVPEGALRYRLLSSLDLAMLPPLQWRVRGIFPATGLAAIYGPSMSGKSFLAFDMAAAIAGGEPWFNARVTQCPVVYVCLEGEAGYKLRAQAWEMRRGQCLPESLRFVLQPFALTNGADLVELAAAIADELEPGGVVIIDTLNRAAPGIDENSSKDMGTIIEASKRLQERLQGLVVLVAHTGKDTSKGLRGHSSLIAALDAAIEVRRDGDIRAWEAAKVKDGRDGASHAFHLELVPMGFDDVGDELTSCVIAEGDAPAIGGPRRPRLGPNELLGLRSFNVAASAAGKKDRRGNLLGVHIEDWRGAFYRMSTGDTSEAKKKQFLRARNSLVNVGMMTVADDVYALRNPAEAAGYDA